MANTTGGSIVWKIDADDKAFVSKLAAATTKAQGFTRSLGDDAIDRFSGSVNRAADSLSSFLSTATKVIGVGLGSAFTAATVTGFKFNSSVEQATTKLTAFTGSADRTASILSFVQKEALATQFNFTDLANAAATLTPVSNASGIALEKLIRQAEVLAALNPAQGLEGAAFSLREAFSSDFVSVVERFNLPRKRLNELKEQGVPATEAISIALQEMGVNYGLVAVQAENATARFAKVQEQFTFLAGNVSKPFFDIVSISLEKLASSPRWNQVEERLTGISEAAAGSVSRIIEAFESGGISAALEQFSKEFAKLKLGDKITKFLGGIDFVPIIQKGITALITALQNLPAQQTAAALSGLFFRFFSAINFVDLTSKLVVLLVQIVPEIIDGIIQGFITTATEHPLDLLQFILAIGLAPTKLLNVVSGLLGRIPLFGTFFKWLFDALAGVSQAILKPIRELFEKIITAVTKPFINIGKGLFDAGKQVIQGFLDGAGSILAKVGEFFLNKLPGWIREPFKKALGIKSPSTVFAGFGENIVEGLVRGISGGQSMVEGAVQSLGDVGTPVIAPDIVGPSTNGGLNGSRLEQNNTFNVYNQVDLTQGLRDLAWQLSN